MEEEKREKEGNKGKERSIEKTRKKRDSVKEEKRRQTEQGGTRLSAIASRLGSPRRPYALELVSRSNEECLSK